MPSQRKRMNTVNGWRSPVSMIGIATSDGKMFETEPSPAVMLNGNVRHF